MSRLMVVSVVGWALAVVLVALLATYLILTAPVRRGGRLLSELGKVEVGTTTLEQFRQQLQRAKLKTSPFICNGNDCNLSDRSEVPTISRIRLAPQTAIVASVSFNDGIASEIYIWLEVEDHNTAGVMKPGTGATIHESLQSRTCPEHFCTYVSERSGYPWAVVEMDASANKEDRARAFALDIGCLTKIGGCKKVSTILPQVFGKSLR